MTASVFAGPVMSCVSVYHLPDVARTETREKGKLPVKRRGWIVELAGSALAALAAWLCGAGKDRK